MLPETHRAARGHDFYPPASAPLRVAGLYATEHLPTYAKTIRLHHFVKDCHWWVVELDQTTGPVPTPPQQRIRAAGGTEAHQQESMVGPRLPPRPHVAASSTYIADSFIYAL